MDRFKHHGFSREDIIENGGDVADMAQRRFDQAMRETVERHEWNTKSRTWGHVWTSVSSSQGGLRQVVAGLGGCMTGVTVAEFPGSADYQQFASDFEDGKVFALENQDLWTAYVRDAHRCHAFDSDHYQQLVSLGRTEGLTPEGDTVTIESLKHRYLISA
jgi:hypothetical protein